MPLTSLLLIVLLADQSQLNKTFEPQLSLQTEVVSLQEALLRLGRENNLQIAYVNDQLQGIEVLCRYNELPLKTLFDHLLAATPLTYKVSPDFSRVLIHRNQDSGETKLQGQVLSANNHYPLPYALIEFPGAARVAYCDAEGRFQIPALPREIPAFLIKAGGYNTHLETQPLLAAQKGYAVSLNPKPHHWEELSVIRNSDQAISFSANGGGLKINAGRLGKSVSPGTDLLAGMALLPGLESGMGMPGISMRGGRATENLVLVDGIKLFQMDHTMGHFSAVNTDMVSEAEIFKSNYPATYGDRVAGVMNMETARRAEKREVSLRFDRELGAVTIRQPLNSRLSFAVSYRTTINNNTPNSVASRVYQTTFEMPPVEFDENDFVRTQEDFRFRDTLFTTKYISSGGHQFSFTAFTGRDTREEDINAYIGEPEPWHLYDQTGTWGNDGLSLKWSHLWNDSHYSEALIASSDYQSRFDGTQLNFETYRYNTFTDDNSLNEKTVSYKHVYTPSSKHQWSFGFEISQRRAENFEYEDEKPIWDFIQAADEKDFFLQHMWTPHQRLEIMTGLRHTSNNSAQRSFFEPRLSLFAHLTEHWAVKAGYGHYTQFTMKSPDTINYFNGITSWFLAEGNWIRPIRAEQTQAGIRYSSSRFIWDIEAFQKNRNGAVSTLFDPIRYSWKAFRQTEDEIEGIESTLWFDFNNINLLLGYTYQEAEVLRNLKTKDPLYHPTDNDRPHHAKAALNYDSSNWHIGLSYQYLSGRPYSEPGVMAFFNDLGNLQYQLTSPDTINNYRLPSTTRVDSRIARRWAGKKVRAELGVSVTNLLDKENVYSRYFQLDQGTLVPKDVLELGRRFNIDINLNF